MLLVNLWDKQKRVKWDLLVVYGATHDDNKIAFLTKLAHFYALSSDPLLIGVILISLDMPMKETVALGFIDILACLTLSFIYMN